MMSMRLAIALLLPVLIVAASIGTVQAEILINIDKSSQTLTISRHGEPLYTWPVSTGRIGHATPSGAFTAFRMEADHYSKEWDDAPMPNSIFFTKFGHAIHGTYETKKLGTPASHGCVRLSPAHAATLYAMVKQDGVTNTKVVLTGSEQVALTRRGSQRADYTGQSNDANPIAEFPQPQNIQPSYRQNYSLQPNYDQSQFSNRIFDHGQLQ
jgi:hypothetical protein